MGARRGAGGDGRDEGEQEQGQAKHGRNVIALAALALAGCGQATDRPQASGTTTPKPTIVATPPPTLSITTPDTGAQVKAGKPLTVSGKATADLTVLLTAGCARPGCQTIARAGADGRWHATLKAFAKRTTIEASDASAAITDRIKVRVRTPVSRAPRPSTEVEPIPTARPKPTRVVMVGDSLAVGTRTLLPALLPGYRVATDARIGRPLAEGMRIIARQNVSSQPTVLAVSLFTNDSPNNVEALDAAVRATVGAVGENGCAVWATIARPPQGGVSYRAANARLAQLESELSPHLILVPWAEQVSAEPRLLVRDHVHGTAAGYQARAALYAQAIEACGG